DRAEYVATLLEWLSECRIRQEKIRHQRVWVGREDRFPEVAGLGIIGASETDPWHDGKPAEISVRVEELVKGIEADGAVILKARSVGKCSLQIGKSGFAFVENGSAEKRVALNIQDHFRQTLGLVEELVRLKTHDSRQGVERVGLGNRDHIVWNRIDAKLTLVEILHHERIAQLRNVHDAVDVIGKVGAVLQADSVSSGRNCSARQTRTIYQRV